jgi:hypothetical protein
MGVVRMEGERKKELEGSERLKEKKDCDGEV